MAKTFYLKYLLANTFYLKLLMVKNVFETMNGHYFLFKVIQFPILFN